MTDTTTMGEVALSRDSLTLVTVSRDYYDTGECHARGLADLPHETDDERTFYATGSPGMGSGWATLILPESDPRHEGMWTARSDATRLGLPTDSNHYGWNIEKRYLTPVVDQEQSTFTAGRETGGERLTYNSPVTVGERLMYDDGRSEGDADCYAVAGDFCTVVSADGTGDLVRVRFDDGHESHRSRSRFRRVVRAHHEEEQTGIETDREKRALLPVEEAYPVGSVWHHRSYGETPFTVAGHRGGQEVLMLGGEYSEARPWVRGALDSFGTFVGWSEKAHQEDVTAPETAEETAPVTLTQEDVDKAVREALAEERRKVEAWKEHANEIAIQYAIENGLCGEFERCMDEIGFRGRNRDYVVTFSVRVEARDADGAVDQAIEQVYDMSYADLRNLYPEAEED